MPLITAPAATCTVAANTSSVAVAGLDLNYVKPGMLLHIGSRQKVTGDGYIINTVTPSGTSGGTLTTIGDIPSAATSAPFIVNALAFNGDGASLGLSWISRLVNRLTSLTGSGSSYDAASRVLELDRETSAALSRLVFKTAGVQKFAVELRAIGGVDCLDFRYSDGTNWASAFYVRIDTGAVVMAGLDAKVSKAGDTMTGPIDVSFNSGVYHSGYPRFALRATGAGANEKIWNILTEGAEKQFKIATVTDDQSASATALAIVRSGNSIVSVLVGATLGPLADNTYALGGPSARFSVVYAGTDTINTSDAREKTPVRGLSAPELAAARDLAAEIGVYQWLASIEEKGENEARWHVGMTVQRAIDIMEGHGLDPWRYGFICRDEITRRAKVTRTQLVQAVDEVEEIETDIEIRNGVPVQVTGPRIVQRPRVTLIAVKDEAGRPVLRDGEPLQHPVPVMVEKEIEVEIEELAGDRLGFRYDQLTLFMLRGLAARVEVLEV